MSQYLDIYFETLLQIAIPLQQKHLILRLHRLLFLLVLPSQIS
jgi:hypothetical protein